MSTSVSITTTQNVRLNYEMASIGDRVLATLIDLSIIFVYEYALIEIGQNNRRSFDSHIYAGLPLFLVWVLLLLPVLYFPLMEIFNNGRSVGKVALNTRVVRLDGTEPRMSDFIIRWLFGLLEIITSAGGFAIIAFLVGGRGQRLGDMAAGTTVAKLKRRVKLEDTLYAETPGENHKVHYPGLEVFSDGDMETIKELLDLCQKEYTVDIIVMLEKAKQKIENKLGVQAKETDVRVFLMRVLQDYNYVTGR